MKRFGSCKSCIGRFICSYKVIYGDKTCIEFKNSLLYIGTYYEITSEISNKSKPVHVESCPKCKGSGKYFSPAMNRDRFYTGEDCSVCGGTGKKINF